MHAVGVGVFIAISSDMICSWEPSLQTDCELLWVKINVVGCKTLYICAFYNPDEGDALSLENFESSLK